MDIISFSEAATANSRIEIINANPDSTSGIVTVPKTIASGETITIPAGRVAVLPNLVIDGVLNIENGGEVFIPSGSTFGDLDQRIDTLNNTTVKLAGNQTIAGVKTFSSNIVGSITGNAGTSTSATSATKWTNARTITMGGDLTGSVSIDGSSDVTLSAQVNDNSHNHTSLSGTVLFSGSTGDSYNTSNIEVRGNGNTLRPGIGFHQPALYAGTLEMLDGGTFQFKTQAGQLATVAKSPNDMGVKTALNATGAAPIYACRAWVNFNGTGTVAIRASGNVSSITDNGVGDYTVNFTTAMPDANYSLSGTAAFFATNVPAAVLVEASNDSGFILKAISALRLYTVNNNDDAIFDAGSINISIFR